MNEIGEETIGNCRWNILKGENENWLKKNKNVKKIFFYKMDEKVDMKESIVEKNKWKLTKKDLKWMHLNLVLLSVVLSSRQLVRN